MSTPRYIIRLSVGDMYIATKLKTKLGNIDDLEKEILLMLVRGDFRRIVEGFHKNYGGHNSMVEKWFKDYIKQFDNI